MSSRRLRRQFEHGMPIGGDRLALIVVSGIVVAAGITAALVLYNFDLDPADPPAVMTGAPAVAPNVARPEAVTTTGQSVPSGDDAIPHE
jgi:hypothetical protein